MALEDGVFGFYNLAFQVDRFGSFLIVNRLRLFLWWALVGSEGVTLLAIFGRSSGCEAERCSADHLLQILPAILLSN